MRAAIAGLAALALSAAAWAGSPAWVRSATLDGTFSIETPCSASEVESLRNAPEDLGPFPTKKESRVICRKSDLMMVASVLDVGQTDQSAFDLMLAGMKEEPDEVPKVVSVNGHRAILNREEDEGYTAQVALVELDKSKLVVLLIGFEPASKAGPAERAETIDRFTNSLKVTDK